MSNSAVFDQNHYLSNNADVVVAISQGHFANALDHFNQFGGKELRAPNASFDPSYYAINNADVLNAVAQGTFPNVFAHYQEFGESENRAPNVNLATFDATAYLAANTDVAAAITAGSFTSALDHFIAFGQNEARTGSGVTAPTNPGSTFTLTTGSDQGTAFTGGTGADTFIAIIDDNTAANNTLGALDVLNGGAGTDTLQLTADTSGGGLALPAANITDIENILVRNASGQNLTINSSLITGETNVISDRSTSALILTNLADATVIEQRGNQVATNSNLTAGYAAAATTSTVNITNGTTAGNVQANGTGLTTITINSSGQNNTVGTISSSGDPTTVNINATTNLTATALTVATNTGAQSLNIVGAGNVSIGTIDDDFATVAAGDLTGNLTATLNGTVTHTFTSGAGDDVITTSTNAQTGAVSGGGGTDVLALAAAAHIDGTAEGAIYTNFETMRFADNASLDMDLVTGSTITAIQITDGANATAITDMTAAQAADVTFRDVLNTATLSVKNASTVGSQDVLNITISDGDTNTNEDLLGGIASDGADWTIVGVETITINAVDQFDADALNSITGMTRLNLTGAGTVNIITGAVAMGTNGFINAGDATGAITIVAAALATDPFAYTGSSGVDTFTDGAIGGNQISTGAGNDIITLTDKTGGTATTVVTGGAGADTTASGMIGNVNRDAMKFNFAAGDSISDGSTTGISATLTDIVNGLSGTTLSATAGTQAEFDTEVQATAVTVGAAVSLGTTTVTNGGDFYINIASATVTNIYQDTDGDSIIESGEFALTLTGIATNTLVAGDFAVTSGDLILATT